MANQEILVPLLLAKKLAMHCHCAVNYHIWKHGKKFCRDWICSKCL